jgi:hypothetical protein
MNQSSHTNHDLKRFFSSGGAAFRTISNTLQNASIVRIATAYFEPTGYQCLRDVLRGKEVRLLLGRPDTGSDKIAEVISEFLDSLAVIPFNDRIRAMEELRNSLKNGRFLVSVSDHENEDTTLGPKYIYHHAKLYMADEKEAVVTSANFSQHGLMSSREAGYVVSDAADVRFFIDRFDYYYEKAVPVADELLRLLEEWLKIYRPYDIYMRSLLELYGLPDDEKPGRLPALAAYQRPVVARVLRNMDEHGGAMLVASTGLGKTIMAAHTVAHLRSENKVYSALVFCPSGLSAMWRRTMRAAMVSSEEFSYYILSIDDWSRYREMPFLERELKHADKKTIIILDESHHLRNSEDKNELRLRHQRNL